MSVVSATARDETGREYEVEVSDPEPTALVVAEPPDVRLSAPTPEALVGLATRMANALADIVEKKRLYAVISGRKFPTVEAWMTVGRMDGVVAREASKPTRFEDGSWEAEVELIRLTDGATVGRASAICGDPDDKPWNSRPAFQRRSMAVTRATGRAFRQQYSWVMALAGYEPTPAEEMTSAPDSAPRPVRETPAEGPKVPWSEGRQTLEGRIVIADKAPADGLLRQGPEGAVLAFRFDYRDHDGITRHVRVDAQGALADDISDSIEGNPARLAGKPATVEGELWMNPWDKGGKAMPAFGSLRLERLTTPDWTLPVPDIEGPLLPLSADEVAEEVDGE